MDTGVRIHFQTQKADLLKQRVKRAERADIFAERAVDEYGQREGQKQNGELPRIERMGRAPDALIQY